MPLRGIDGDMQVVMDEVWERSSLLEVGAQLVVVVGVVMNLWLKHGLVGGNHRLRYRTRFDEDLQILLEMMMMVERVQ